MSILPINIQQIRQMAEDMQPELVRTRRYLHAHPELSFQEHQTADYLIKRLGKMGLEVRSGLAGGTGLTADIHGQNPHSRMVALRADTDALPILEANEVSYKSVNPGVMHACGHDVHTTSLLGCATILNALKEHFEGTIRLIFQPGEERLPGGASLMIADGVLRNPAPAAVLGQHVMPALPVGKVGFRQGMYMASADEIFMTIVGKGGHAALPEQLRDPVIASAHILVALQQVVSRWANPKIPSVLSFGHIIGKGATNVIPDKVYIEGTFRTMDEAWRKQAHAHIERICKATALACGVECELEIRHGYPFLQNHVGLSARLKQEAIAYLGADKVVDLDMWMASEDFAYYTLEADSCFYRLGTRNEAKGIVSGVHTPTFDIDEDALQIGAGLMAWFALCELEQKPMV